MVSARDEEAARARRGVAEVRSSNGAMDHGLGTDAHPTSRGRAFLTKYEHGSSGLALTHSLMASSTLFCSLCWSMYS